MSPDLIVNLKQCLRFCLIKVHERFGRDLGTESRDEAVKPDWKGFRHFGN